MKKAQKKTSFTSFFAIVLSSTFLLCSCQTSYGDKAEKWLNDVQEELNIVAEYLAIYDYPDISIDKADGTMLLLVNETVSTENTTVSIENEEVNTAISKLFSHNFISIHKCKEDNSIEFLRKTRFNDFGAGLVYSIDKTNEPKLQFLTKLEPLAEDGWYYYEEDFNEWRLQQEKD